MSHGMMMSNSVRVDDPDAFEDILCGLGWCAEGDLVIDRQGDAVSFHILGAEDPVACPWMPDTASDDPVDDLDWVARELRQHLIPGETLVVTAVASEKARMAQCTQLVVSADREGYVFRMMDDRLSEADVSRLFDGDGAVGITRGGETVPTPR